MTFHKLAFAPFLLSLAVSTLLRADDATLVNDSILDPLAHNFAVPSFSVSTVHGVTFQQDGITTYKGWQYATYYQGSTSNSNGKVAVSRRQLPQGAWETLVLTDYTFTSTDSHNDVVLGICPGDGSIHLSFDHHATNLKYRLSTTGVADNPTTTTWSPALFGTVTDRLTGSTAMSQVTYPRFIATPAGNLLFTYRKGTSGGGDEILYEYSASTHAWSLVGQYTTRSGSYTGTFASGTDRNGYFDNTLFDANGRLHTTWCWRETSDPSSNHDLLYAYSDDAGRTWKNQLGATVSVTGTSFISVSSPGILGWSIPQKRNFINNSGMTIDKQGRVHVATWQLPNSAPDQTVFSTALTSASRFSHYWRGTDGIWRKNETTLPGTRAKLSVDDDGRLFLIYGDATNIRIATASPAANPEFTPSSSWSDWAAMNLSGALPAGKANTVNIVTDTARWDADRIISVYAQETYTSVSTPTPLHILDYHVSRAAVLPVPLHTATITTLAPTLSWTAGQLAVAHDVYLGTSASAVAAAGTSSPEYAGRQSTTSRCTASLASATPYYWRVDSVTNSGTVTPGRVWSFTTGDLLPAITQGTATRSYGGRASFPVTVDLKDPALTTGDLTLYYGTSDGGTNPAAWQQSLALGPQPAGNQSFTLDGIPSGTLTYRFKVTTPNGASWAASSSTLSGDDLASWAHSALLTPSGYTGTETLTDFPVLIRLSPAALPGFAYDQMLSPPYGDLHFSTPSGTLLVHEVETWDSSGTSQIWVKLPQLATGTQLRIWWGKAGQSPPPAAPTWSAFNGVWHLDGVLGFDTDSTASSSASSTALAPAESCVIPGTADLNGTSSTVAINNTAALNPTLISVEAWVKTSAGGTPSIFNKDNTTSSPQNRVWQFRLNGGKPEFIVFSASSNATVASPNEVNDNEFHYLCGTWDGTTMRIYVDGILKNSTALSGALRNNQSNKAFIGRGENLTPNYFTGSIDEVRLSPVARSADWIRATFDSQKPAATLVTAAPSTLADLDADHLPDAWEIQHFATTFTTDPDPDSDGSPNLLEFALGTDPNSGSDRPELTLIPASGATPHEFIYHQLAGGTGDIGTTYTAAGLRYMVELSADLSLWQSGPTMLTWSNRREPLPGGMERVGIHVTDPILNSGPRVFTRLRVVPAN